jgi:hypothetical protein
MEIDNRITETRTDDRRIENKKTETRTDYRRKETRTDDRRTSRILAILYCFVLILFLVSYLFLPEQFQAFPFLKSFTSIYDKEIWRPFKWSFQMAISMVKIKFFNLVSTFIGFSKP